MDIMNNTGRMDICWFAKYGGVLVCCLYTLVSFSIGSPFCQPDLYYDVVTYSCAPCSDICVNANIQRTLSQCRRLCPDFFSSTLKTSTMPATTTLSHNATSPQLQDENIQKKELTTVVLFCVSTLAIILAIILSVCCIVKRIRQLDTRQHADNEQGGDNNTYSSRFEKMFLPKKRQPTVGSLSETLPLTRVDTKNGNEQPSQQPQEHDVNPEILVSGAKRSKPMEQGGIEAQTQRKEVDTTQDQD